MTVIEDLDYAEDLLSSKHQNAQQKAECHSKTANTIGIKDNTKKTLVLRKNIRVNNLVIIDGKHQEVIAEFTYLGTKVTSTGDCDQ